MNLEEYQKEKLSNLISQIYTAFTPLFKNKMAEHLLSNGIIVPLFTIGDTVWIRDMHNNVSSHKITGLDIMSDEFVKPIFQYYYQDDIDYRKLHMFTNEDVGKVAFFTKEEAKTDEEKNKILKELQTKYSTNKSHTHIKSDTRPTDILYLVTIKEDYIHKLSGTTIQKGFCGYEVNQTGKNIYFELYETNALVIIPHQWIEIMAPVKVEPKDIKESENVQK